MKPSSTDQDEIFADHMANKGLVSLFKISRSSTVKRPLTAHVFVWAYMFISRGSIPNSRMQRHVAISGLAFWGSTTLFSTVLVLIYIPPAAHWGSHFFPSPTALTLIYFYSVCSCGSVCICLISDKFLLISTCLFTHYLSLGGTPTQFLVCF